MWPKLLLLNILVKREERRRGLGPPHELHHTDAAGGFGAREFSHPEGEPKAMLTNGANVEMGLGSVELGEVGSGEDAHEDGLPDCVPSKLTAFITDSVLQNTRPHLLNS
jgi:hypothetical protein